MSWPQRIIHWSFSLLFVIIPLIVLPWTTELFEFNKLIATYILATIIVTAWTIRMILEKRVIFTRTSLDLPLILFLLINLCSLLFSIDPRTSWLGYYGRWNGGLLSLLSYSLLYWAFVSNLDNRHVPKLITWLLGSAAVVSLYGILQHFGIDAHLWVQDVKNRVFSTLGQPNWLAAFLVALMFIPISHEKLKPKHYALFILFFITLLFTKSRSGLLAFGVSSLIFWAHHIVHRSSTISRRLLIFLTLTLALTLVIKNPVHDLIFPSAPEALVGPALESGGTESGIIRQIVWKGALNVWRESGKTFWLGTGPETFALAYYQHRPLEHNSVSEWEFLYNKAHNEFLNYLSTTGLVGLLTYLFLLLTILRALRTQPALLAGWVSLSVTNFWGFSVVPTQLLLFLLPAIAFSLSQNPKPQTSTKTSTLPKTLIIVCLAASLYMLITLGKYWLSDYYLAQAQKWSRNFSATSDPSDILASYQFAIQAYDLNPNEPIIASQLGESAAYMAILTSDTDATSSAQLLDLAYSAATSAIALSPSHPSHYKSAFRALVLLSALDDKYLTEADLALATAEKLSPTDPRLPYNRGVVAKYQGDEARAKSFFEIALTLKPDFPDALSQLDALASPSASIKPTE